MRPADVGRLKPGAGYSARYPDQMPVDGARVPLLAEVYALVKARAYAAEHPEFELHRPAALYNEAFVEEALTYWPDAWLYRLHPPAD